MLHAVMTRDEADRQLLMLADEKGKFAVDTFGVENPDLQFALERGIDAEWFTLADVSQIMSAPPGRFMRIFRLTTAGWNRRRELMS